MPYSGSLSDKEREIIAPLLPKKKQTRPAKWSKRQILDGVFYQLKNRCNWGELPKGLPPYSTVFWHYKQWRKGGVLDEMQQALHCQVRERAQKKPQWTRLRSIDSQAVKTPAMPASKPKDCVITNAPMASSDILQSIIRIAVFHALHESKCNR